MISSDYQVFSTGYYIIPGAAFRVSEYEVWKVRNGDVWKGDWKDNTIYTVTLISKTHMKFNLSKLSP